jgi:hypothetical protein
LDRANPVYWVGQWLRFPNYPEKPDQSQDTISTPSTTTPTSTVGGSPQPSNNNKPDSIYVWTGDKIIRVANPK